MKTTANGYEEAWEITKTFLDDENESLLMLRVEAEPHTKNYTIVKLPFGETISLLYFPDWFWPRPGIDLQYSGFYSRRTKMVYDMRDHLNWFYKFGRENIYTDDLIQTIIKEIQKATAGYIASHAEEFSGLSITKFDDIIADYAAKAFSVKETILDFAAMIPVEKWNIQGNKITEYIDNPEKFLKQQVEERIKNKKEEFARLWAAHCVSQKILDRYYTEYNGGETNGS